MARCLVFQIQDGDDSLHLAEMAPRGLVGEFHAGWCLAKGIVRDPQDTSDEGKIGRHDDADNTSVMLTVRDAATTQVLLPSRGNTGYTS